MAPGRILGCLPLAALVMCALIACNGKGDGGKAQASAAELDKRCHELGKICGDKDKHVDKIVDECKQAAKKQVESGCTDKAIAVYDCYVQELCGGTDKVWSIDDLGVLAERHGKCVAEREASRTCGAK